MAFGHGFDWKPPSSWPARSAGVIGERLCGTEFAALGIVGAMDGSCINLRILAVVKSGHLYEIRVLYSVHVKGDYIVRFNIVDA
jgi:hypothetical protein